MNESFSLGSYQWSNLLTIVTLLSRNIQACLCLKLFISIRSVNCEHCILTRILAYADICCMKSVIGRRCLTYAGVVLQQFPLSAAATVDPSVWCEQTQILTASIIHPTGRELTCAHAHTHTRTHAHTHTHTQEFSIPRSSWHCEVTRSIMCTPYAALHETHKQMQITHLTFTTHLRTYLQTVIPYSQHTDVNTKTLVLTVVCRWKLLHSEAAEDYL